MMARTPNRMKRLPTTYLLELWEHLLLLKGLSHQIERRKRMILEVRGPPLSK
jgi:hypothetical protein